MFIKLQRNHISEIFSFPDISHSSTASCFFILMPSISLHFILKLDLQVKSGSFADFLIVSELGCGIQRGCMGLGRLYQVTL